MTVRPNYQYQLRWGVKSENVAGAEGGPILRLYYLSGPDSRRTFRHESGDLPKGTFDWQRRTFTFTTDESSQNLWFSLQLRRASGTVWHDGVELVELGPVRRVETY